MGAVKASVVACAVVVMDVVEVVFVVATDE